MFLSISATKKAILEYFRPEKKNRKSTSGEFFSSRTRLNLGQFDVSNMSVAHLEQIRHAHGDFLEK